MECCQPLGADIAEMILITDITAVLLSICRTVDEINFLANVILTIGSLMVTIAAQQTLQESKKDDDQCNRDLQKQIDELRKQLKKLEAKKS